MVSDISLWIRASCQLTSVYVRRKRDARICLRPLLGVSLPSAFRLFERAAESCRAAVSYIGLQSVLSTSLPIPLRCICIAAKAMIALRTTGASAAMAPKKARVDAHFGPCRSQYFIDKNMLRQATHQFLQVSGWVALASVRTCSQEDRHLLSHSACLHVKKVT